MANPRLASAGGSPTNEAEPTWTIRSDLGFFAVVSPFGRSAQAGTFALERMAARLEGPSPVRPSLEHPACAQFREAILVTEAEWQLEVGRHPSLGGLGATFAGILLRENCAAVAHLGDCRALLIRGGQMNRRTTDHSQVLRDGRVALLRAFGLQSNPEVHLWQTCENDLLVITRGGHDIVEEGEVVSVVCQNLDNPAKAASALTELALTRGGKRPVTAVVVRV